MPTGLADSRLRQLNEPALESLLRGAPPPALRAFAGACARLAVYNTEPDQPAEVLPALRELLSNVAAPADDRAPDAESLATARTRAAATMGRLDEAQLSIIGRIDDETGGDGDLQVAHREYPAYLAAFRCFIAASVIAAALREDPFEAAVECAYLLVTGIRMDPATVQAMAETAGRT